MKVIRLLLSAVSLSVCMMSCGDVAKRVDERIAESREIVGRQDIGVEVTDENSDAGNTHESSRSEGKGNAAAKYDNLEIPAPLSNVSEQLLYRKGYTVSYNKDLRIPNWVAWHLTASRLKGNTKRSESAFHEDEEVAEPRAKDFDYVRSGYDRGHMCPAGDNKWNRKAMEESFLFSNICPQAPSLNRGDWNEMEQACRKWAKQYGDIYIVCGPIFYKKRPKTIGKDKVAVPDAFFKVVLVMNGTPKAIGFIYKNADGNRPKGDYANSVDEVERITGIDFFPSLPDKTEKKVEARYDAADWNL